MLLSEFKELLLAADPKILKRRGVGEENHTIWTPGGIDRSMSDDTGDEMIQRIYVDRYTRIENDEIVRKIWKILESNFIPFEYEQDTDTVKKFNHHIFTCYVQIENERDDNNGD